MITLRPSKERGHSDIGWLDSRHTFSFSDYYDPQHMGFASLRVMNEDWVAGGAGFGTHPHRDMEIITYVLEGELEHKDSMGHTERLRAGELQRMTAGSGITHSEYNALSDQTLHLYQIWLLPEARGLKPTYEQKVFDPAGRKNQWQLVVQHADLPTTATNGAKPLGMRQDAKIFLGDIEAGKALSYTLPAGRAAWLQLLRGSVTLNGTAMTAGDGAAISKETEITVAAADGPAEVILFDLN